MTLPSTVREGVEAALRTQTGRATTIESAEPVGGGCISPTARVEADGDSFFLKWRGPELPSGLLGAEARGLHRLAEADAVRVPDVVASDPDGGWLLLEWLEPGRAGPEGWGRLGRELARLHRSLGQRFGADRDNFIGSLPQSNEPMEAWSDFWRTRRLEPQLRRSLAPGLLGEEDRARFEALYDRLEVLLGPGQAEGPSLLHGDLWSGNVHMLRDGSPALIDPSVYHGHREVDLAMTELFGGFGPAFRGAYEEAWPLEPGYAPARRAVYQLYYLLVHVNLFGAGYVGRTRRALGDAGV